MSPQASRRRYREYLAQRRRALQTGDMRALEHARETSAPRRTRSFFALFAAFLSLLRGHVSILVFALSTLSLATALGLLLPAATKVAIDYILTDNPGPAGLPAWARLADDRVTLLWTLAAAMMAVTLLGTAVGMAGRWQVTRLTKRVQASLRRETFRRAVRLPLHRVHALRSGGLAGILREDAGGAAELLFSMIYNPWRAVIQLLGTLVVVAWVDRVMLLGAILVIPLIWITHRTWIARIRPVFRDIKHTRTAIDARVAEAFGGMRVVRGFNRQHAETARFARDSHFMARQEILAWWWSRGVEIAWQVIIPLASSAVLLYGGWRVIEGSLTVGDVMMFSAYMLMLLGPLEALASTATAVQQNLAGFDRVLELLAEPLEFQSASARLSARRSSASGHVSLRHVTFAYPSRAAGVTPEPALRDINLDIQPGETIALVGPSGSGKTTLCNLVARFHDPSAGQVLFDGADLRDIRVESYRRLLGIVEQDVFLFDGTVEANIGYARRGATHAQVRDAADAAGAHEFISRLERGYETVIGERGVKLSGGQKQRIAIARAILADPVILILDEATSNLDTESERLIQRGLARLMRGRTSLVIAHRLSTVRHADRIVVLEHGRIIEVGPHEQLLASAGRYARLLRAQVEDVHESTLAAPTTPA